MARDIVDQVLRERVRRNVGRLAAGFTYWPGLPIPGRYGTIFRGGELLGGEPPQGGSVGAPLPPGVTPLPSGRTISLYLQTITGTREVAVTNPLPAPVVLRQVTIHGNIAANEAASWRLLLSDDADTTATANPTGTDIVQYGGDLVGAEDPGVHTTIAIAPLVFEPWTRILNAGKRLKLKHHNVTGATRVVGAIFDLDDILTA